MLELQSDAHAIYLPYALFAHVEHIYRNRGIHRFKALTEVLSLGCLGAVLEMLFEQDREIQIARRIGGPGAIAAEQIVPANPTWKDALPYTDLAAENLVGEIFTSRKEQIDRCHARVTN
jgi:hypothetical protein